MMDNILDIQAAEQSSETQSSYIKIIGVGGAGTNAVNHMYNNKITGVDFIVCNTDKQSLNASPIVSKIQLGEGLGAGNSPAVAKAAAEAAKETIKESLLGNTHMLFIAAGMGGGTGTGASPVIAQIAKEIEVDGGKDEMLVVGIVTIPFSFEGRKRMEQAKEGIKELREHVDAMIVVNTDKLKDRGKMTMRRSFALADDILLTAARGISEIMTANAYIHVDFKDVQSVMRNSGVALMGSGEGEGEDRAYKAIVAATTCDLLNDNDLSMTKNVLLYISCSDSEDYEIDNEEIEIITEHIRTITNPEVDVIWGYGYDNSLEGKITITLVATGFESKELYTPTKNEHNISSTVKVKTIEPPMPAEPVVVNTQKEVPATAKAEEELTNFRITKNTETSAQQENRPLAGFQPTNEVKPQTEHKKRIIDVLGIDGFEGVPDNQTYREEKKSFVNSVVDDKSETYRMVTIHEQDSVPYQKRNINMPEFAYVSESNSTIDTLMPSQNTVKENPTLSFSDVLKQEGIHQNTTATSSPDLTEARFERMKKVRAMLGTKSGLEQVQRYKPVSGENIDTIFSDDTMTNQRVVLDKNGNVTVHENPVVNSSTD
ncbi:MAG: cell division protein FtsZ [Bacteroidales bacterium]|nr:cell division protein FtsZ [Bacteroidales bacterium]